MIIQVNNNGKDCLIIGCKFVQNNKNPTKLDNLLPQLTNHQTSHFDENDFDAHSCIFMTK